MKSVRRYERCATQNIRGSPGLRRLLKVNRVYLYTYRYVYICLYFTLEWGLFIYLSTFMGASMKDTQSPKRKTFFLRSREFRNKQTASHAPANRHFTVYGDLYTILICNILVVPGHARRSWAGHTLYLLRKWVKRVVLLLFLAIVRGFQWRMVRWWNGSNGSLYDKGLHNHVTHDFIQTRFSY